MSPDSWPGVTVLDWKEFAHRAEQLTPTCIPYPGPFLFRGVPDESSPQKPALAAYLSGSTIAEALEAEGEVLTEFRSRIDVFDESIYKYNIAMLLGEDTKANFDYLGWWSFMHHYDVPTRLLAWTLSPYIALYHAIDGSGQNDDKNGSVYCYNGHVLTRALQARFGANINFMSSDIQPKLFRSEVAGDRLFLFKPKWMTDRMTAQQTLFTVCQNPLLDHVDILNDLFKNEMDGTIAYHFKLIIPRASKQEFLHRLRVMNVTTNSLYPGIDGAGVSVAEFVRLMVWADSLPTPTPT
jgi:hypothetical protein